jgi:hypothetical protein
MYLQKTVQKYLVLKWIFCSFCELSTCISCFLLLFKEYYTNFVFNVPLISRAKVKRRPTPEIQIKITPTENSSIFSRVRKVVKSDDYFRHVCLSLYMEQLGSHGTYFHEIWYLRGFRKSVERIQMSLKSDTNNGYFRGRTTYMYDNISMNSWYNEKCFKVVVKIKIHILRSVTVF